MLMPFSFWQFPGLRFFCAFKLFSFSLLYRHLFGTTCMYATATTVTLPFFKNAYHFDCPLLFLHCVLLLHCTLPFPWLVAPFLFLSLFCFVEALVLQKAPFAKNVSAINYSLPDELTTVPSNTPCLGQQNLILLPFLESRALELLLITLTLLSLSQHTSKYAMLHLEISVVSMQSTWVLKREKGIGWKSYAHLLRHT